jgi:undecaprenyl-diphosphatase
MNVGYGILILLAVIQGLTEFLPVSSSGHLAIVETLLGLRGPGAKPGIVLEVAVHVGTLGAVVVYYRKRLLRLCTALVSLVRFGRGGYVAHRDEMGYIGLVIVATIPAAVVGVLFGGSVVRAFDSAAVVSVLLVATGLYLLVSRLRTAPRKLTWRSALVVGLAQAIAILPGCSRSGWTITTGLLLGLGFAQAAEFSFIMSIPAIIGALVLELAKERFALTAGAGLHLITGAAVAFLAGWIALRLLIGILSRGELHRFSYYLLPAGIAAFVYFRFFG